jgi:hypothetical protein
MTPDNMTLEKTLLAYMQCALWSSVDSKGDPLDANYELNDFAPQTIVKMREDVRSFIERMPPVSMLPEQLGHDFWLTRHRHGSGFWDRGLGDVGAQLTELAHAYPQVDLYVDDNFQISA